MPPAVPRPDGLAGHVVEHPALPSFHAELVDAVAEHVVGVTHHDATQRIVDHDRVAGSVSCFGMGNGVAHGALVAFDIQLDAGGEALLSSVESVPGADDPIACPSQERPAQGVEMGGGGGATSCDSNCSKDCCG